MSKQELLDALKSEQTMAEYLEVRDDGEIISDIRSVMPPGLFRREYFAAAALPALIARHRADIPWRQVVPLALELADALIAASKTGGPEHG